MIKDKIYKLIFDFIWRVKNFRDDEQDIKYYFILWFFLRHKKYKIYMKWLSLGTNRRFAFDKAKNNVPHFDKQINKDRWIRKQKLKRVLK